jgi:hypothetical protein
MSCISAICISLNKARRTPRFFHVSCRRARSVVLFVILSLIILLFAPYPQPNERDYVVDIEGSGVRLETFSPALVHVTSSTVLLFLVAPKPVAKIWLAIGARARHLSDLE